MIDGEQQELTFQLSRKISLTGRLMDTILISWDENNIDHSVHITQANPMKNRWLQTDLQIRASQFNDARDVDAFMANNSLSDSLIFEKISRVFETEIKALKKNVFDINQKSLKRFAIDTYFNYTKILFDRGMLPKYQIDDDIVGWKESILPIKYKPLYKYELADAFHTSVSYRRFLFDYLRIDKILNSEPIIFNKAVKPSPKTFFSPAWDDYYNGLANLHNIELRDWFIANSILANLYHYSFDDVDEVYLKFKDEVKTKLFADTLKNFHLRFGQLRKGSKAQDFTLPNQKGEVRSLKMYRGMLVYINFWSKYCGACLNDIKGSYLTSLQNHYKGRRFALINICVDDNINLWRNDLQTLKLTGVNLISPGWRSAVCKKYQINGLPHYVLIDKNGRIFNNNSPGPAAELNLFSDIDKILDR